MFLICPCNENIPKNRPPFKQKATRGIDCNRIRRDLPFCLKSFCRGLQVPLYQIIINIHVQHFISFPIVLRHDCSQSNRKINYFFSLFLLLPLLQPKQYSVKSPTFASNQTLRTTSPSPAFVEPAHRPSLNPIRTILGIPKLHLRSPNFFK